MSNRVHKWYRCIVSKENSLTHHFVDVYSSIHAVVNIINIHDVAMIFTYICVKIHMTHAQHIHTY